MVEWLVSLNEIVIPEEGPDMTRYPPKAFELGDQLEFTCSSCCSYPVTNFTWSVNTIMVIRIPLLFLVIAKITTNVHQIQTNGTECKWMNRMNERSDLRRYWNEYQCWKKNVNEQQAAIDKAGGYISNQLPDGTYSSRSVLKINANEANFIDGIVMRVRCTAFIAPDLYWKTSEVVVKLPRPSTHQQLSFKTPYPTLSNQFHFNRDAWFDNWFIRLHHRCWY